MREKVSLRERFRRFVLRLFKGVPAEEMEQILCDYADTTCEVGKLNNEKEELKAKIDVLEGDIKRKDGSIAFFHRFGTRQPVKLHTKKTYSGGEYCDAIRRMCVLDDLAQGFLPAIKNCMWYQVDAYSPEPTAVAELWLYPLNDDKGDKDD